MSKFKTAGIVVVVSLLVWIFAEGESLRTTTVSCRVDVVEPAGMSREIIEPVGFPNLVTLTLRGSNAGIDSIKSALDARVSLDRAQGIPAMPGDHAVNLAEALRKSEVFISSGVTIEETEPESLRIRLTALQEVILPIVASVEAEIDGVPTVEPESVAIYVPVENAPAFQDASAIARVTADRLGGIQPGAERQIRNVKLELPANLRSITGVRGLERANVTVTLTLRDTTSSAVLNNLPVQVSLAVSELNNRWKFTIDDPFINNVSIRGPSDLVARVVASAGPAAPPGGRVTVIPILQLSFEELEQGITSKAVEFLIRPAGAGVLQIEAEDPIVTFTIERVDEETPDTQPDA
jgi:hypothetical protein